MITQDVIKPNFKWPVLLLHPNIPKPMHGLNPRTLMGQEWWDVQREKAYKENNYCCWACGVHKSRAEVHYWLEAHECYLINYQKGVMHMKLIAALCHLCHNYIHRGRLSMILEKGQITRSFYNQVLEHGDRIQRLSNMTFPRQLGFLSETLKSLEKKGTAEWSDWRLIIGFRKFKPIHNSLSDWALYYLNK